MSELTTGCAALALVFCVVSAACWLSGERSPYRRQRRQAAWVALYFAFMLTLAAVVLGRGAP